MSLKCIFNIDKETRNNYIKATFMLAHGSGLSKGSLKAAQGSGVRSGNRCFGRSLRGFSHALTPRI